MYIGPSLNSIFYRFYFLWQARRSQRQKNSHQYIMENVYLWSGYLFNYISHIFQTFWLYNCICALPAIIGDSICLVFLTKYREIKKSNLSLVAGLPVCRSSCAESFIVYYFQIRQSSKFECVMCNSCSLPFGLSQPIE